MQNVGRGQRHHAATYTHALRFLTSTVFCKYYFRCICPYATAASLLASLWRIYAAWYKAENTLTVLLPSYMYPRQCMSAQRLRPPTMAEVVGCAKDQELSVEAASVRYINVTSPLSMEPNLACTVQATVARSGQQGPYAAR